MTIDEGYIKFNCRWVETRPLPTDAVKALIRWRQKLYESGLIGLYPNGIGFGNISERYKDGFIISGTQTGGLKGTDEKHYTLVFGYSIEENEVQCKGPVQASSESLTHAMFYELDNAINAVIHVHHRAMWHQLKSKAPTSSASVPYGTPAMAEEVKRLYTATDLAQRKIMVMGGHEEGIITFGNSLDEAGMVILNCLKNL